MKKIFILTGEPSGDKLASKVIANLKKINPSVDYLSVGGENLKSLGIKSIFDLKEITYLGFTNVILNIFQISKKIDETVKQGNFGHHDPGKLNKSFYAFGAKNTNVRDHFNPAAQSLDAGEYAGLLNKKFESIKLKTIGDEKAKVQDRRNKTLSRY